MVPCRIDARKYLVGMEPSNRATARVLDTVGALELDGEARQALAAELANASGLANADELRRGLQT